MKNFKREQNAIIIHFIFYFALTIWLVVFTFSSIYPQLKTIEETKLTTKDIHESIKRIEKSWLTFDEFKILSSLWGNNRVVSEILKSMTDDFYTKSLVNTSFATYEEFLNDKTKELNSIENKEIAEEKIKQISKILPLYSDSNIDFWGYVLSDYKFVNYVESIIESFNFTTSNSIWISKINLLKDFAVSNKWGDALESNIYYIPLKLVLNWTKEWVIEFLHFIENVGNIEIKEGNIELNNNFWFLLKNKIKKVLEWDKYSNDYNIFEHQMIDISRIIMSEYIDSSYVSRWEISFRDFIIDWQWTDSYEISVDLMFYVKWQPAYKLEEFILWILDKHKITTWLVNVALRSTDLSASERRKILKHNETLKQLGKEILSIRKELVKKEKLEELYINVLKIDEIIDPIFQSVKKKDELIEENTEEK